MNLIRVPIVNTDMVVNNHVLRFKGATNKESSSPGQINKIHREIKSRTFTHLWSMREIKLT